MKDAKVTKDTTLEEFITMSNVYQVRCKTLSDTSCGSPSSNPGLDISKKGGRHQVRQNTYVHTCTSTGTHLTTSKSTSPPDMSYEDPVYRDPTAETYDFYFGQGYDTTSEDPSSVFSGGNRKRKKRSLSQRMRRKINKAILQCISESENEADLGHGTSAAEGDIRSHLLQNAAYSSTPPYKCDDSVYEYGYCEPDEERDQQDKLPIDCITPPYNYDYLEIETVDIDPYDASSTVEDLYTPMDNGVETQEVFNAEFHDRAFDKEYVYDTPVKLDPPTNTSLDEYAEVDDIPDEGSTYRPPFGSQNGENNNAVLDVTKCNRDAIKEATKSCKEFVNLLDDRKSISGTSLFAVGPAETYSHASVVKAKQASQRVVESVSLYINKNIPELAGTVRETGSSHDHTKVGKACEFDYMHEFHRLPIKPELRFADTLSFAIYTNGKILNSFDLYEKFSKTATEALNAIELPPGVQHGGFYSPEFSGVRNSGPAVTILLLVKFEESTQMITVDLTPALPVSVEEMKHMLPTKALTIFETWFDLDIPQIHFVPTETRLLWRLSTAYLDVEFMNKVFAVDGKARLIIRAVKLLADKLLTIRQEEDSRSLIATIVEILRGGQREPASDDTEQTAYFLCQCHQPSKRSGDKNQDAAKHVEYLRNAMRKHWFKLNPGLLAWANEIYPAYVSVRSCAIKYLVIRDFMLDELSDEDGTPPSLDEIRSVLKSLSSCREIKHPFLGTPVKTKSVTSFHAYQIVDKPRQLLEAHDALLLDLMEKLSLLQKSGHSGTREEPMCRSQEGPAFGVRKVLTAGLGLWYELRHVL